MKIRTKVFWEIIGYIVLTIAIIFSLEFFFGKYGIMIYVSGVLLYLLYCLYNIRVSMLEREQDRTIEELKK